LEGKAEISGKFQATIENLILLTWNTLSKWSLETEKNSGRNSSEISNYFEKTKFVPLVKFLENSNWNSLLKFQVENDIISFHIPLHR
jgi:hypothetical protein